MEDDLMTYKELAKRLNTKLNTIYALVSQKRIPHVRLGKRFVRFSRVEIEAWIAGQTVSARPRAPTSPNRER